jgi:hypothetical protein
MKFACAPETRPLSGYTIKRAIDRGAFGEVYYAVSDAGKEVALKLLHTNQEAELRGVSQCLNLKHPNLVAIYDIRTDDEGDAWVVMEYIAGESLETRLARSTGGLPVDEVLKWVEGFAAGIDYLHARGIVHRDLKPANVFLDGGLVKIADVGLSKFMTPSRRSAQTESVGTVYYMAPEVAHGKYGRELDVYSLGIIAYEMLTGRVPFEGESTGEILMKHLAQMPDLGPLPERVRPVIAAALEKDPQKRTATAGQLAAAFRSAVTGKAVSVDAGAGPETAGATAAFVSPPPLPVGRTNVAPTKSPPVGDAVPPERPAVLPEIVGTSAVPGWLFPVVFGGCLVLVVLQRASTRVKWEELAILAAAAALWQGWEWWQGGKAWQTGRRFGDWFKRSLLQRGYEVRPDWRQKLGAVVIAWLTVSAGFIGFAMLGVGPLAIMLVPGMAIVLHIVVMRMLFRPVIRPSVAEGISAPVAPLYAASARAAAPVAEASPVPPPLPVSRTGSREGARVVPSIGDLFTSLAAASGWSLLLAVVLAGVLPEWDEGWLPLRQPGVVVYLVMTTALAAWLLLMGVWVLHRQDRRAKRLWSVLLLLGLAAGAAVYGVGQAVVVDVASFAGGPTHGAIVTQLGRHPLERMGEPTLVGLMSYFGLLFGVRSWWTVLSPARKERIDLWDAAWTTLIAFLLTYVVRFPPGLALLWGLGLAIVPSLAATRFVVRKDT